MTEGFLSRWSQRKQAVRDGQPVAEVIENKTPPTLATVAQEATKSISKRDPDARPDAASDAAPAAAPVGHGRAQPDAPPNGTPAPTLDDVQALQPGDSFARFVAPDVSPSVRNAAMKKLFADPHYNVMDGLDIYIDDYSIASPLPAATLRQMASAQFLNLFDEDPAQADVHASALASVREVADTAPAPNVAQSVPVPDSTGTPAALTTTPLTPAPLALDALSKDATHDDPDLRLQPNDAAGRAAPKREPERAPDAAQQPVSPSGG